MGNFTSMFDPLADLPDLKGKVVVVTGGNTGIGYATIKHLARRGAKVYMAARSESKATEAIARLEAEGLGPGNGQVVWHLLDLSHPRTAMESAEAFLKKESKLDILVNNAAAILIPYTKTEGVQDMMVVNHFSPFVFTNHLLPLLKKTAEEPGSDVRIVNVSSAGHRFLASGTRFRNLDDINREYADSYWPNFSRYSMSKLANILWTNELQKRLDAEGLPIIVMSIHPGSVNTFLDKLPRFRALARIILPFFLKTWDQGAYNSAIAAASPVVRQSPDVYRAAYFEGDYGKVKKPSADGSNPEAATELWEVTSNYLKDIGLE